MLKAKPGQKFLASRAKRRTAEEGTEQGRLDVVNFIMHNVAD